MTLPRRLLIANRGEIACRIIRTAQRLGIETVAVHSEADTSALHVRLADQAVCIGPAPASSSYLDIDAVIAAARATGAEAVHPGYGFLSENDVFAESCASSGIVFVGPPPSAIRAMGSKSAAKSLMEKSGVPVTPGFHGETQDLQTLQGEADRIGYPLLIKASAGGGGRGMRRVERTDEFAAALASCQREAVSSFGDERVLLERYVERPRHIEIQIFADRHGNCIHLGERDCSVQRRHQKVIEESPAPGLDPERRAAMGAAAIKAALAVGYVGAGTVEFIVAPDGTFYFMEMNTRLQVEHPVTEMVTGLDLVEWQLRVAAGEPLPMTQSQVELRGHAIEVRIYAEDPTRDFLPSTGRIVEWLAPATSESLRIDAGYERGDTVTPHYDAMLAKVIAHAADRGTALQRLREALDALHIVGPRTNVEFLRALADSPSFVEADLDTALIERERENLARTLGNFPDDFWPLAAVGWIATNRDPVPNDSGWHGRRSPWSADDGWRLQGRGKTRLALRCGDRSVVVELTHIGSGRYTARTAAGDTRVPAEITLRPESARGNGAHEITVGTSSYHLRLLRDTSSRLNVFWQGRQFIVEEKSVKNGSDAAGETEVRLRAPMPGRITAIHVAAGHPVKRGSALLTLEAMKMQNTLTAPVDGQVKQFRVEAGSQVTEGAELLLFEPQK